jgi:hypothetical protein
MTSGEQLCQNLTADLTGWLCISTGCSNEIAAGNTMAMYALCCLGCKLRQTTQKHAQLSGACQQQCQLTGEGLGLGLAVGLGLGFATSGLGDGLGLDLGWQTVMLGAA